MSGPILVVTDATELGGAERYLSTLITEARQVADVRFRAIVRAVVVGDELRRAGADPTVVPSLSRRPRARAVRAVLGALSSSGATAMLINLTDQGDNQSGLIAARLARRITSVAVLHLWVPGRLPPRQALYAAALRLPDRLLTPGSGTAASVARLGIRPHVVPNGLRPVAQLGRDEARHLLGVGGGGPVVGGVGRLTRQKGWDLFARAWPAVRAQHSNATALVIGDGPERTGLERSDGGVRFVGPHPDAARLLSAFDLLVVPSRFEAHALVPIEAALAGLPAVVADIPGVADGASSATLLIPKDDPSGLTDGILTVLSDLPWWTEQARSSRAAAKDRFDPVKMARSTLELLQPPVSG